MQPIAPSSVARVMYQCVSVHPSSNEQLQPYPDSLEGHGDGMQRLLLPKATLFSMRGVSVGRPYVRWLVDDGKRSFLIRQSAHLRGRQRYDGMRICQRFQDSCSPSKTSGKRGTQKSRPPMAWDRFFHGQGQLMYDLFIYLKANFPSLSVVNEKDVRSDEAPNR